ncbi:GNAT family N-acetyltransferase [Streptomyces gobiensis]|uniref:GNAT family N-acetyltransferase n=1 Tax=Streptomyces gobiensis TaxID=2875706 RepID=UPI001E52526A|nr:GNAT family N-acetyltransferase [Streptomyces gobiensis]UGY91214.1 GNAT family N-acetyltransferase [Streptomyces gobiensis]
MAIRTALVPLSEIFPLRWTMLRPDRPPESAKFPEDTAPAAFHIAAYDDTNADTNTVLSCGSFYLEGTTCRIRGMATAAGARGQGYGAAVLDAGTAEAIARGAKVMWCNGRTEARGFYERHGYTAHGEEFMIEDVGPHYVLVRELS